MVEVTVRYAGGVEFRALARGHELICDQPADNGGADAGMTPPELLLASIATCAGFYAAQYLNTRKLSTEGLSIRVTAEKSVTRPVRLEQFRIMVDAPQVPEEHWQGLHRAIEGCLIHRTLAAPSAILIELTVRQPVS